MASDTADDAANDTGRRRPAAAPPPGPERLGRRIGRRTYPGRPPGRPGDGYGPCLRAARAALGITQRQAAAALGVSPQNIVRVEADGRDPRWATAYRAITTLELGLEHFFPTALVADAARRIARDPTGADRHRPRFGAALRAARAERGLVQRHVAHAARVSLPSVGRLEANPIYRDVVWSAAYRAITALGLGLEHFFPPRLIAAAADRLAADTHATTEPNPEPEPDPEDS